LSLRGGPHRHRRACSPEFIAPLLYTSRDLSVGLPGTRWWLGQPEFHDAAGHVINNATRGAPQQAAYFVEYYQRGDRFGPFSRSRATVLSVLAPLILGFAMYWTARRVS